MTWLWRRAGNIMVAIGTVHTAVFLVEGRSDMAAMVRDGLVGSVFPDQAERRALWYGGVLLGACLVLLGVAVQSLVRQTGRPAPAGLGWGLAVVGTVGGLVAPISGTWPVLVLGLLMVVSSRAVRAET